MKKTLSVLAFLAMTATACNKVDITPDNGEPAPEVKMVYETISGSSGSSTKATIADSDAAFSWTENDHIAVHVSNGESHKYVFTSDAGASGASVSAGTASFTVAYEAGYARDAFAVFPSTIVSATAENYGQDGHTLDVTLPDSYTLAQVSSTTTPCPMIATNTPGSGWTFKQLCGLLRLTVNDIPSTAKRLEIDFDGKKVCGDFSIASNITPGESVIATTTDPDHDIITISKDGSNTTLGATSLVLNIPIPTGDYTGITVVAYDALSGGSALKFGNAAYNSSVKAGGKKRTVSVNSDPIIPFTFTFKNQATAVNLDNNLRFVRLFSNLNKLHNGTTTYGPYTTAAVSSSDPDIANPVSTNLLFDRNPDDLIAFQVLTSDGKVYAGNLDVPAGGFRIGKSYDLTVNVNTYTFTVASGKKVYFSPGDLGVDGDVYSFTEPFASWNDNSTTLSTSKRTWFNYTEVSYTNIENGHSIYGIKWRNTTGAKVSSTVAYEMDYLVSRTIDDGKVEPYYHVQIGSNYCLLLPPDETVEDDLNGLSEGAVITNYAYYLAKGFILLWNKGRMIVTNQATTTKWGYGTEGWYWIIYNNSSSRILFRWTTTTKPVIDGGWANQFRMRVRYVRDVE